MGVDYGYQVSRPRSPYNDGVLISDDVKYTVKRCLNRMVWGYVRKRISDVENALGLSLSKPKKKINGGDHDFDYSLGSGYE